MSYKTPFMIAAVAATALTASQAMAAVINVDFDWIATSPASTYSGQGALSDPGNDYWNGINTVALVASGTNLLASDGVTASGVNVSANPSNAYDANPTNASNLLASLLNDTAGYAFSVSPFSITGLPADTDYTMYLYNGAVRDQAAGGGEHFPTTYAVTGSNEGTLAMTGGIGQPDPNTTLTQGFNYAVFTGNTGAGGSVSGTWNTYVLSGLQISFESTPAPEPASLGMLGLGGLALLLRRRKHA